MYGRTSKALLANCIYADMCVLAYGTCLFTKKLIPCANGVYNARRIQREKPVI